MAKHTKTAKVNIPMCIASVLFCLTLISIHLTSGLYAKYVSSSSGNDSARVITFGNLTLTETGDFNSDGKLIIIPGVDLTKKAIVNFAGSESATYIFIEVTVGKWILTDNTDNRTFSIDSNNKVLMKCSIAEGWEYLKNDNETYVYYQTLSPNTILDKADIIADDGTIMVSEDITRSEMGALTGVSIKLRASAVQSDGFDSPEAAWNSIVAKEGGVNG